MDSNFVQKKKTSYRPYLQVCRDFKGTVFPYKLMRLLNIHRTALVGWENLRGCYSCAVVAAIHARVVVDWSVEHGYSEAWQSCVDNESDSANATESSSCIESVVEVREDSQTSTAVFSFNPTVREPRVCWFRRDLTSSWPLLNAFSASALEAS